MKNLEAQVGAAREKIVRDKAGNAIGFEDQSEKDKKREEELNPLKIFSTHEFFIPDGLGCSVEIELHEYYTGDYMNEEPKQSAENVRITFLSDLGELDLQISIPKSVFQRLLSLGKKFGAVKELLGNLPEKVRSVQVERDCSAAFIN